MWVVHWTDWLAGWLVAGRGVVADGAGCAGLVGTRDDRGRKVGGSVSVAGGLARGSVCATTRPAQTRT